MRNFIVSLFLALILVNITCVETTAATQTPTPTPAPKPVASAGSAADFYKDNTVTLLCAMSPGGSMDIAARLYASFWSQVTGGNMIVKNMTGGGGLVGLNYAYAAKPTGLTIATANFGSVWVAPVVFGDPAVKHDLGKWSYVGGMLCPPWVLCIGKANDYKSFDDLKKAKGLKFAAVGPTNVDAIASALVSEFFGLTGTRIISGYPGAADTALAVGRGECDAFITPASAYHIYLEKGFIKPPPVMVISSTKSPYFPDVPALPDLVRLTPDQQVLFDIVQAVGYADVLHAGPPGIPEDRLNYMREKFAEITALPAFQSITRNFWPVWVAPKKADDLKSIVERALAVPKKDVARLNEIVKKYVAVLR